MAELSDSHLELFAQLLAEETAPAHETPRERPARLPLSYGQELLWLLDRATPELTAYNSGVAGRLTGTVDVGALQRALDAVVARHESLRTTFGATDGVPEQAIHEPRAVTLTLIDLRSHDASTRERTALDMARDALRQPFDLATDLLLRATLVRTGETDYILALASHHIVSDGLSREILLRELGAHYAAFANARTPVLPPLARQYADLAIEQRTELDGARYERLLDYWRSVLGGATPDLELPTDFPRPPRPSFEGSRATRTLDRALSTEVRALARRHHATTFMSVLAAYHAVLHRWTGVATIVSGSPVAGRSAPGAADLIGYFANMVAIRSDLSDDPTFGTLLARVRSAALGAFDHDEMPLEKLVMELRQGADRLSPAPLFQVALAMDVATQREVAIGDLTFAPVSLDLGTTKFDFSLFVADRADGITLSLEYRTDLFAEDTATRLLAHLERILAAAAANDATHVSALPLVAEAERGLLLRTWNDTTRPYPRDASVHDLFAQQAGRTPDAIAVTAPGLAALTYAELDQRANQLAHHLVARGVVRGSVVAICLAASPDLIVAMLAALKAGATYLTMDPEYPAERLAFMAGDAAVTALILATHNADPIPSHVAPRIALTDDADAIAALPVSPPPGAASGGDAANIVYTSGSTGKPKGVLLPHRGITRLAIGAEYMRLAPADVMAQVANPAFDAMTWEVWTALLSGAQLAMMPRDIMLDPAALRAEIGRSRVTALLLTTAVFNQVARATPDALRGVRYAFFGGEAADDACVRLVQEHSAPEHLINAYGPTEGSVIALTHDVGGLAPDARSVPIGRPIANTHAYILDRNLQIAPIGMPGELCIAGDGIALGYINRPELSAERFIANPYVAGERMYRTGDLARWRTDGTVEFIGRNDNQVKLRGVRIELGEIEGAVAADPAVAEALAMVREVAPGDARLICYFVPVAGVKPDLGGLRASLQQTLPHNMVPSALVPVAEFPLTPNGKVNRAALPEPVFTGTESRRYVAPRTTIEHQLVRIWEALLDARPIGIRDDFFEIGGHSLLAVRMLAEAERVAGRRLPLATLFEGGTIERLASLIESAVFETEEPPVIVLQESGPLPPLIFVHGDIRGGGWYCRRLAPLISAELPMLVLPSVRMSDYGLTHSIEEIGAHHVRNLRRIQPHGPYRVAGFCAGGNIAYEVAQQLVDAGEQVSHIILIDTIARNARFRPVRWLIDALTGDSDSETQLDRRAATLKVVRYYLGRIRRVRSLPPDERRQWLQDYLLRALRIRRAKASERDVPVPDEASVEFMSRPGTELLQLQSRAVSAYISRGTPDAIDLIVALDRSHSNHWELHSVAPADQAGMDYGTRGWERVAKEVRVHGVPATHMGLITDQLAELAAEIRACLGLADRAGEARRAG